MMIVFILKCLIWLFVWCYVLWACSTAIWTPTQELVKHVRRARSLKTLIFVPPCLLRLIFHFLKKIIFGGVALYYDLKKGVYEFLRENEYSQWK